MKKLKESARRVALIRLWKLLWVKNLAGWDVSVTCVTIKQAVMLFLGGTMVFIVKIGYLLLAPDAQGKVGRYTTHDARWPTDAGSPGCEETV